MPDQAVVLFIFSVLAGFGIIWAANTLRLSYPALYLEYFFNFTLATVAYGFVNWVVPYIVVFLAGSSDPGEVARSVVVFILIGVPLLLVKLYFFFLLFQELLGRKKPKWLNAIVVPVSILVLLLTTWAVKSFYDGEDLRNLKYFIIALGVTALVLEFLIVGHFLFVLQRNVKVPSGVLARPLAWLFLGGYVVYVFFAYSSFLPMSRPIAELTPYVYFIIHGLPLLAVWLYHHAHPVPVAEMNAPGLARLIRESELTPREVDVLKQIIGGASNQEIAEASFISPHTVRNHIYSIYNKTGIRNRFQLLAYCQQEQNDLVD